VNAFEFGRHRRFVFGSSLSDIRSFAFAFVGCQHFSRKFGADLVHPDGSWPRADIPWSDSFHQATRYGVESSPSFQAGENAAGKV